MKNGYTIAAFLVVLSVCGAAATTSVRAQNAQKTRKPTFGSEYTKLRDGWKDDPSYTPAEVKEDEAAGRDIPQVHAGFGGYSFFETYSARASYRSIVAASKPGYSLPLSVNKPTLQICRDTVEWRTANGKPFAVIARVETFDGTDRGGGEFAPASRIGQFLVVRGLRGYESIKADINAADKNANARARAVADAGYLRAMK